MNSTLSGTEATYQLEQVRLLITMNNLKDALELLKRAVGKEPDNPQAFNLLGVVYERRGDLDAACRLYRAALALEPDCRAAKVNLHRLVQWTCDFGGPDLGVEELQGNLPTVEMKKKNKGIRIYGYGKINEKVLLINILGGHSWLT